MMTVEVSRNNGASLCAQCGLPVLSPAGASQEQLFCCHACRLVSKLIGKQQGEGRHAWNLLRLSLGALLSMNIMMISLILYSGRLEPETVRIFRWSLLVMSAPALALLLHPLLQEAMRQWKEKKAGLETLIAGGSLTAFSVSVVATVAGKGDVFFDTATMLPVLVTFGKIIESTAKTRAADLLHALETLMPAKALRVTAEGVSEVDAALLSVDDVIRVRPGERIAVDGRIVEGWTTLEEAAFTGEFLPRSCGPGDGVLAGTVNGAGPLLVRAEKIGPQVLLHRIVSMVDAALRQPSQAERIAERAGRLFVPLLLCLAAGTILFWTLIGDPFRGWFSALSVLVVACPCTIGIATPLATSVAIARAAKAGVIVRGGSVMEQLGTTDLVFFDKTGTLTSNKPLLQEIISLDGTIGEDELLGRLSSLEVASEHPLAQVAVEEARARGVEPGSVRDVEVFPGRGISGKVSWNGEEREVRAGTACFAGQDTAPVPKACTAVDVAWGGAVRGRLLFTDTIRNTAAQTVNKLAERGVGTTLLSGDRYAAAAAIASKLGIDRIEAPCTPEQKRQIIVEAVASGRSVAMVGDGINDAPALAAAQTGIAMGGGMDLARLAGNVVILSENLGQVPWVIELGRYTRRIIRQNFALSFGYNAIALAAAAAGYLSPLLAALAMVVSSVTVLGNSMRIGSFPNEI